MTVLYKLLYFIDFDYYEKFEDQLVGATYIKNHFGPTPVEFKKIVDSLQESKVTTALCCDKIDRLIRNFTKELVIIEELRRKGKIELHFPSDNIILHKDSPATDLFRFTIGVSLAKYYSDSISDNVKRAYETKIRKGEWIGKAPIGYIHIVNPDGSKDIIPDPERYFFILNIFELYASGNYLIRAIQAKMKKAGLRSNTKNNTTLGCSHIYGILNNTFYYGMMRIKNDLYPHRYDTLIYKDLYDKCQEIQNGWNRKPYQPVAKPYIFRGLIKCADCGCTVTPETQKGHIYYSCTNFHKVHDKRVYVKENELLQTVYELMDGIKLKDEVIDGLVEDLKCINQVENNYFKTTVMNLQKEYDQLESMIDNLTNLNSSGLIDEDLYLRKIKQYSNKQKTILEQIAKHDTADKNYDITAKSILKLAQKARELFDSSEVKEKRQLLNFLLQNCELKGKKLQYKLKSPFDTILLAGSCSELYPLLYTFRTLDWKNIAFQLNLFELDTTK